MISSTVLDVAWLVLACAFLVLVLAVGLLVFRRGLDRLTLRASPKDGVRVELTGVQSIERTVREETAQLRELIERLRADGDRRAAAFEKRMDRAEAQNSDEHRVTAAAIGALVDAVTGLTARMDGVEDAMTAPGGA